jgi:hypothetical protein
MPLPVPKRISRHLRSMLPLCAPSSFVCPGRKEAAVFSSEQERAKNRFQPGHDVHARAHPVPMGC